MSGKSIWIEIIMLIGLSALSACALVAVQAEDDRQVYENEEFGYSFRFPAECTFGPMFQGCKSEPPEERPAECLCFLNAENPNEVFLQAFLGEEELTLAGMTIAHYDTPLYNPPAGTDLVVWLQNSFSDRLVNIPDKVNGEIGGLPVVRIITPASPMAVSYEDIFVLSADRLLQIRMADVDSECNLQFYEKLLSTFRFME